MTKKNKPQPSISKMSIENKVYKALIGKNIERVSFALEIDIKVLLESLNLDENTKFTEQIYLDNKLFIDEALSHIEKKTTRGKFNFKKAVRSKKIKNPKKIKSKSKSGAKIIYTPMGNKR